MTNEERWIQFILVLQAYILEHHHLSDKIVSSIVGFSTK